MSVSYTEKLLLTQALHGGHRTRRARRNRRVLSLCAKVAFVSAVALVFTGIAMAAPAVGAGAQADYANRLATGTTLTARGAADAIATNASDSLIRLAGCGSNCGRGRGPSGLGPPGNTGPGTQGNTVSVGNAGGFGGFPPPPGPPGGLPPGPPGGGGGLPPGDDGGGGTFADQSGGDPTLEPYLLIRPNRGANGGGTSAQGRLGLAPAQMMCSVGGISVAADGSVIFARFFADQTGPEIDRKGCEEVVRYPDTEDMAGK